MKEYTHIGKYAENMQNGSEHKTDSGIPVNDI